MGAVVFANRPHTFVCCLPLLLAGSSPWPCEDSVSKIVAETMKNYRPRDPYHTESTARRTCSITARELQVLDLLALGYSSKENGDKLNISCRTVENHSANLRRKFGVRNTVSLVRALLEGNLPGCS